MNHSNGRLNDRVAIVTGAARGIGAAIARRLAADGAAVAINYASRSAEAGDIARDINQTGGRAITIQGRVDVAGDAERVVNDTIEAFGRLDILVNNAAVFEAHMLGAITIDDLHRTFDTNVFGVIAMVQASAPKMTAGGSIVNIGSMVSRNADEHSLLYAASKSAVDALSQGFAKDLGPSGIRVNTLAPGGIDTESTRATGMLDGPFAQHIIDSTPLGRLGRPEDIAEVVAFLASDDARWITGERIVVSGGAS